jgi:hypothetical protein
VSEFLNYIAMDLVFRFGEVARICFQLQKDFVIKVLFKLSSEWVFMPFSLAESVSYLDSDYAKGSILFFVLTRCCTVDLF